MCHRIAICVEVVFEASALAREGGGRQDNLDVMVVRPEHVVETSSIHLGRPAGSRRRWIAAGRSRLERY
jgi:hypothetical protein